jgi:LPXTG-site transpeptidase (sortase) family protein
MTEKLKSKRLKIILAVISVFIAACLIFLVYLIVTTYLVEKDRQAQLILWESQKQTMSDESAADSDKMVDEDYPAYGITAYKEVVMDYGRLTAEDFFPLKLSIPKIELEWISYEGTDTQTLKQGPGHIEETPLPGDVGRCTISGHRTTYGSPFSRIDELVYGDLIYLETINGEIFTYVVTGQNIVNPEDVYVLEGSYKRELLLTACHPKYSAAKRLIIIAELVNLYPLEWDFTEVSGYED